MYIAKKRQSEIIGFLLYYRTLLNALDSKRQSSGRRHRTQRREIGLRIIFQHMPAVSSGVNRCYNIHKHNPHKLAHNYHGHYRKKHTHIGYLSGIGKQCEIAPHKNRKQRQQYLAHKQQYHFLKFLKHHSGCTVFRPDDSKTYKQCKQQSRHSVHRRKTQIDKWLFRQRNHLGLRTEMKQRNKKPADRHRKKSRSYRRQISQHHSEDKQRRHI